MVGSVPVALVAQREITAEISRSEATRHHAPALDRVDVPTAGG